MIGKVSFHCWRDAQRLMNTAEIVVHGVERNRVFEVLQLFAECVGQPGKAAIGHSQVQVMPFDK